MVVSGSTVLVSVLYNSKLCISCYYTPVEGIEPPNIRFAGGGINLSATPA